MGPTALLPSEGSACYGFLSPVKIHRPRSGYIYNVTVNITTRVTKQISDDNRKFIIADLEPGTGKNLRQFHPCPNLHRA
jgi:hypothetical protein